MKRLSKWALINFLCLSTLPAIADDSLGQYNSQKTASNTENMVKYLRNLGGYLGYDLAKDPTKNAAPVNQLLDLQTTQDLQKYMFGALLGAVPVNAFSAALSQFLPTTGIPGAATLNPWANNTFTTQKFKNPASQGQGTVNVIEAIDQKTYQQDPVSQAVLNILGTPDISYCLSPDGKQWVGCTTPSSGGATGETFIPGSGITARAVGTIPSTYQYFTYQYNSQFLSQLNSNTLTAPLLYTTDSDQSGTNSDSTTNPGLTASSQAQQAANFIRYVSGSLSPIQTPSLATYTQLYQKASTGSTTEQITAQATLSNYFAALRTYASQVSVGMGNLYFIMSKRLPQTQSGENQSTSSQALSEFNMATRRLYNPDMSANKQWINQINDASPATVQKEMAVLLAEINYQMYLQRQIQERLLLTNSVLLLQAARYGAPKPDSLTEPQTSDNQ